MNLIGFICISSVFILSVFALSVLLHHQTKTNNIMINLNTISKEDLFNEVLLNEDLNDFYITLDEKKFLSLGYELQELKEMLENWLINNCDNK